MGGSSRSSRARLTYRAIKVSSSTVSFSHADPFHNAKRRIPVSHAYATRGASSSRPIARLLAPSIKQSSTEVIVQEDPTLDAKRSRFPSQYVTYGRAAESSAMFVGPTT